jgi:hypothetical protein
MTMNVPGRFESTCSSNDCGMKVIGRIPMAYTRYRECRKDRGGAL